MNPYAELDNKYFWAPAVGKIDPTQISSLWNPKRDLFRRHKIATYGSCFAQHFGRALRSRKYGWMMCEDTPSGLSTETATRFNYGIFTARTGNIYTVSLLRQWTEWAVGISKPPAEIWIKNDRFYDPFRPNIEPEGFASEDELIASREITIESFKRSFAEANLFVFTLGLTESWSHVDGYEYPMCPGTIGGTFDTEKHKFKNHIHRDIIRDLRQTVALMRKVNPALRVLLTISPVPLTATMSGNHVLTATVESKSVLRAVAGELSRSHAIFDYFPSYEIICSAPFQGMFYNDNKRTVRQEGVDFVMQSFFQCLDAKFRPHSTTDIGIPDNHSVDDVDSDVVCEEELLGAFSPRNIDTKTSHAA